VWIRTLNASLTRELKPPSCTLHHHSTASEPCCPFALQDGFIYLPPRLPPDQPSLSILSSLSNNRGVHSHANGSWDVDSHLDVARMAQYSARFLSLIEYFCTEQPNIYGKGSPAPTTDNRGVDSRLGDTYLFELLASNASLNRCQEKRQ
jgi:hypothetical protein